MVPKARAYRQLNQRMRRSLGYEHAKALPLLLSKLATDYFDKHAPFDYLDMDFATSLARESCLDPCTFLIAIVYLDRLRHSDLSYFQTNDPSDMYLSALLIASKYLHDVGLTEFVYNDEWAASAGTSLKRINELELQLLDILSWNANVNETQFMEILNFAERCVAIYRLESQGFCTYNETSILSTDMQFFEKCFKPLLLSLIALLLVYSATVYMILLAPNINIFFNAFVHRNASKKHSSSDTIINHCEVVVDGNVNRENSMNNDFVPFVARYTSPQLKNSRLHLNNSFVNLLFHQTDSGVKLFNLSW